MNYVNLFHSQLQEFIDFIENIFEDDKEIIMLKEMYMTMKKSNPKLICKIWSNCIATPYLKEINNKDIDFFIHKDYTFDLNNVANNKEILNFINRLRQPIANMNQLNKSKSMDYISIISKISLLIT